MEFFINEICSEGSLTCPSFVLADSELRNVPTLSQLGLLAMAGLLGIVGFIVVRRRKVHIGT